MSQDDTTTVQPPDLSQSPEDLIQRAASMRDELREQQAEVEERGTYSPEMHAKFSEAGFYRVLRPRMFDGFEFDLSVFARLIMELARGCPSTAWCFSLGTARAWNVASMFSKEAQAEAFGVEGEFIAPVRHLGGTAEKVDDGWFVSGQWDYCSGSPYSSHALLGVLVDSEVEGEEPRLAMALVPRSEYEILSDWTDVFGMRGSGSNSIRVEGSVIPEHFVTFESVIPEVVFEPGAPPLGPLEPAPGYLIHDNPLYAGGNLGFGQVEITAILTGVARAALDEYEEIITTRKTYFPPITLRSQDPDYQRHYGIALGKVQAAEAVVMHSADLFLEMCRRRCGEGPPLQASETVALFCGLHQAVGLNYEAVANLFRTAGSSNSGRNGTRMVRYYRDISIARTNVGMETEHFASVLAQLTVDQGERSAETSSL